MNTAVTKSSVRNTVPKRRLYMPENAGDQARFHLRLNDILERSATLFSEQGYHNTSMRDIAGAMHTSLAGLYYYFKTKEELLFLISQYSFNSVIGSLHEKLAHVHDPVLKLHILVQNHLLYFVTHLDAMKILALESDSLTGEYHRIINEKKKNYLKILETILSEMVISKNNKSARRTTPEIKIAALALFGMMNWTYTWYNPKKRTHNTTNIARISKQMVDIFLSGFLQKNLQS